MTRTITHSEFQAASGEGVYVSTVHYTSAAERAAGDAACQRVVVAAAFTPFGLAGEPQDPPEVWPSDKTAREYTPQGVLASYTPQGVSGGVTEDFCPRDKEAAWVGPPNCDGNNAGEALAQSQYTAAIGGDGCDSVACSITQGVSD